jgi:hypothetical protein
MPGQKSLKDKRVSNPLRIRLIARIIDEGLKARIRHRSNIH